MFYLAHTMFCFLQQSRTRNLDRVIYDDDDGESSSSPTICYAWKITSKLCWAADDALVPGARGSVCRLFLTDAGELLSAKIK